MLNSPHSNDQQPQDLKNVFYKGKVLDNNDPDKLFRVRVQVNGLMEGVPESLPWVAPFKGGLFPNSPSGAFGTFGLVPAIGTEVTIFFDQGDQHCPYYAAFPVQMGQIVAEALTNYLYRYGFKDPEGNLFMIDSSPGANPKLKIQLAGGFVMTVDGAGNVNINTPGNFNVTAANINLNGP